MFTIDKFNLSFELPNIKIYTPVNTMEYHTSRLLQATLQNTYAGAGATEETVNAHLDAIIGLCNQTGELKTIRTDIAGIANALKMRTKYPVDKHCAVRMGIVLTFAEVEHDGVTVYEDPNKCEQYWLERKMELALQHPDLYAFFFAWGMSNTAAYSDLLDTLNDLDYFEQRRMNLMALLPPSHLELSRI